MASSVWVICEGHREPHPVLSHGPECIRPKALNMDAIFADRAELVAALRGHMNNCRDCSWLQVGEPDRCQRCARSHALLSRIDPPTTGGGTP